MNTISSYLNTGINVRGICFILFLSLCGTIGCLDENDNASNSDNGFTGDEHDSRYDNSGNLINNGIDNQGGTNGCGGREQLYFEGQAAAVGDSCGACGDGELQCNDEGDLYCDSATASNECGGCAELPNEIDTECGPGLVWSCSADSESVECRASDNDEVVFVTPDFDNVDADFEVTSTSATYHAGFSGVQRTGIVDHGFCWGTDVEPSLELAENSDEFVCESLGEYPDSDEFEYTADDLLPGRTYYVRAYITTQTRTYYGDEISFTTFAPPTENVEASQGTDSDAVHISWEPIHGAVEYIVFRDDEEIARVGEGESSEAEYQDNNALSGGAPRVPQNVDSTTDRSDHVEISWQASLTNDGPEHLYHIQVSYPDADSELSQPATGYRQAQPVDYYEILVNGQWVNVGHTTNYIDENAAPNQFGEFNIAVSQGAQTESVAISLLDVPEVEIVPTTYQVRAVNAAGTSDVSDLTTGHLAGELPSYNYQWQRSAGDTDDNFSDILGATQTTYADTSAPANGAGVYYRLAISAPGYDTSYSDAVRGFRAAVANFSDTTAAVLVNGSNVTMQVSLSNPGAPAANQHGFCYGTMAEPTHANGATCTSLGAVSGAGLVEQTIGGFIDGGTYYVSAYATNSAGTTYSGTTSFTIAPNAPVVSVTPHHLHVGLGWAPVSGATGYVIYRDGVEIAQVSGSTTSYNDTGATAAPVPPAPSVTSVSQGDRTDGVELVWNEVIAQAGPTHSYSVAAVTDSGDEGTAATIQGNRSARTISGYQIQIGDGSWQDIDISNGLVYLDTDAPEAVVSANNLSASDAESLDQVDLSVSLNDVEYSHQNYAIRAISAAGNGVESQVQGHRGIGASYSYQWYSSTDGSDGSFAVISGATAAQYSDISPPADGSPRYYYVEITRDGVETFESDIVVGARAALSLEFSQPAMTTRTAGEKFDLDVQVVNQNGEPFALDNASINLSVNKGNFASGSASLVATTDVNGSANFDDIGFEVADSGYILSISSADGRFHTLSSVDSMAFEVQAGAASSTHSSIDVEADTLADGSDSASVSILIKDAFNNPVPNVVPTFSGSKSGNQYDHCSATNASGESICAMTATEHGTQTVELLTPVSGVTNTVHFDYPCAGTSFQEGDGVNTPFTVCNVDQLLTIQADSSLWDKWFLQVADIDMTGVLYQPIGAGKGGFSGAFDGGEYEISNLNLSDDTSDYRGLFGVVSQARLSNITLVDVHIEGANYVGGLAGRVNRTIIVNSSVTGTIEGNIVAPNQSWAVGGLIGEANDTLIESSYSEASVSGYNGVGGLVGEFFGNSAINHSYATGMVVANSYGAGGLVGAIWDGQITNSYATGDVELTDPGSWAVGGLIGEAWGGQVVLDKTYATGLVVGESAVGGLIGSGARAIITESFAKGNIDASVESAGGFIGYANQVSIQDSYSLGDVILSGDKAGGFVGEISNARIEQVYVVGATTGTGTDIGPIIGADVGLIQINAAYYNSDAGCIGCDNSAGYARTLAQMNAQDVQVFDEFDFGPDNGPWMLVGSGMPRLLWEYSICETGGVNSHIFFDFIETPGSSVAAGELFDVAIQLIDASNEPLLASGVEVVVQLNKNGFVDRSTMLYGVTDLKAGARFDSFGVVDRSTMLYGVTDSQGQIYFNDNDIGMADNDYILTASTFGSGCQSTQPFNIVAGEPDEANSSIEVESGKVADGNDPALVTIVLRDSFGNPVVGVVPTFAADFADNDYTPCSATNALGQAECEITANTYGEQEVRLNTPIELSAGSVNFSFPCAGSTFQYGDGIAEPFTICNAAQLALIENDTQYWDKKFVQVEHIDMEGIPFDGIGSLTTPFSGEFDGNDFRISNLTIDRAADDYVGLFGYTSQASLRNITLENVDIQGHLYVGALIGYMDSGEVQNSHSSGRISAQGIPAELWAAGGLVGSVFDGIVSETSSSAEVYGARTVGGLIGELYGGNAIIENSFATGKVYGESYAVGGLVGGGWDGNIRASYASGNVDASNSRIVGGFAGELGQAISVIDSYATGRVRGDELVGGFAGYIDNASIQNAYSSGDATAATDTVGGFIGQIDSGEITNILSVGSVVSESGGGNIGRVAGNVDTVLMTGVYFNSDSDCVGCVDAHGIGLTYAEMTAQDSDEFPEFDFDLTSGDWKFVGYGWPRLSWESRGYCDASTADFTLHDGSGTENDPYIICSPAQLNHIGANFANAHFVQVIDIDLSAYDAMNPLTPIGPSFGGSYHGQGHKIDNLYIDRASESGVGLFSTLNQGAVITDIHFTNAEVVGAGSTGIISGSTSTNSRIAGVYVQGTVTGNLNVGGIAGSNNGLITDVEVDIIVIGNGQNIGGIAGYGGYSSIIEQVTIAVDLTASGDYSGGVVGLNYGDIEYAQIVGQVHGSWRVGGANGRNYGTMDQIVTDVDVQGHTFIGGISGENYNQGIVENCQSLGDVTAIGDGVGGAFGGQRGIARDCSAFGNVTGRNEVGGFAGKMWGGSTSVETIRSYAMGDVNGNHITGGFGGSVRTMKIDKSFSVGDVVGTSSRTGSFVGEYIYDGFISNSWASGTVIGIQAHTTGGFIGATHQTPDGIFALNTITFSPSVVAGADPGGAYIGGRYNGSNDFDTNFRDNYWIDFGTATDDGHAGLAAVDPVDVADPLAYPQLDFIDTWTIATSSPYHSGAAPVLQWQCELEGVVCVD